VTDIIAGIDVGTSKICALIAEADSSGEAQSLRLIGMGLAPAHGLEKGMVVNVPQASESIAQAVEEAELSAGTPIGSAYVGISGKHISTTSNEGIVPLSRSSHGVTPFDVERALEMARSTVSKLPTQEIIHTIPRRFTVDEQSGIRDPVGLHGDRLLVEAQVVLGASSAIASLVKCVRAYDVDVEELVLEPLASGEAVLTPAERELGVVLADIGGGTTDIAVFLEDSLWHTVVRDVGGNLFTKDLAFGLRTPFEVAERLKVRHGHLQPELVAAEEKVSLAGFGERRSIVVLRRDLAHILSARAEEILELIFTEIKRSGYDGMLPAGIVLCGGTSQMPGLRFLSQAMLQCPARVGSPNSVDGLSKDLATPAMATGVGLLLWGQRHHSRSSSRRRLALSPWDRVTGWLRNLLPG
jgi:cell division protein FtsA